MAVLQDTGSRVRLPNLPKYQSGKNAPILRQKHGAIKSQIVWEQQRLFEATSIQLFQDH
jgi:hypothetical protein